MIREVVGRDRHVQERGERWVSSAHTMRWPWVAPLIILVVVSGVGVQVETKGPVRMCETTHSACFHSVAASNLGRATRDSRSTSCTEDLAGRKQRNRPCKDADSTWLTHQTRLAEPFSNGS
jgi:hypothetical protein